MGARRLLEPWRLVLAAMVALTAVAVVLYAAAPFDEPDQLEADTGRQGIVPPEHRILAVDDTGQVVVLDDRSGDLSETVGADVATAGEPAPAVDLAPEGRVAHLVRSSGVETPVLNLLRVETGEEEEIVQGASPALHPEEDRLAYVVQGEDGADVVVVRNTVTGETTEHHFDGPPAFRRIHDLVWDPFSLDLLLVAGDPSALWRLATDEERSLDRAARVGPPADGAGENWIAAAPVGDDWVVAEEDAAGAVTLLRVRLASGTVEATFEGAPAGVRHLDADPELEHLLLVTGPAEGGSLYRWTPGEGEPRRLTGGIVDASW